MCVTGEYHLRGLPLRHEHVPVEIGLRVGLGQG